MRKPGYCLWRNDFSSREECETVKKMLTGMGFRVVIYFDGPDHKNIHDGIKLMIKNYLKDVIDEDHMKN